MSKILNVFLVVCAVFALPFFLEKATDQFSNNQFHLASTEAEKKANEIVNFAWNESFSPGWPDLLEYIRIWPHQKPELPLQYRDFFTKGFIYALSRAEKDMVDSACEGRYIAGDRCGLDFIPFTCSQDWGDTTLFRTLEESQDYAIIEVCSDIDSEQKQTLVYKLTKYNGLWFLDGLFCRASRFVLNFSEHEKF